MRGMNGCGLFSWVNDLFRGVQGIIGRTVLAGGIKKLPRRGAGAGAGSRIGGAIRGRLWPEYHGGVALRRKNLTASGEAPGGGFRIEKYPGSADRSRTDPAYCLSAQVPA